MSLTGPDGLSTIAVMADWQMQVTYSIGGVAQAASNVLNFIDIGGDNDETTATAMAELWESTTEVIINQDCAVEPSTRFIWPLGAPTQEVFAENNGNPGSLGTDLYAANCAYRVDLLAGLGPRRRGHIYIPGVSEDEVGDAGVIDPLHVTGIVNNMVSFISDCAIDHGFLLCVYSRVGESATGVSGVSCSPVVRSQRRRMEAFVGE